MSFTDVLTTIGKGVLGIGVISLSIYLRWQALNGRYKGLGDGGIQTIFGDKKRR